MNKIKTKKERGATGIDIVTGTLIFILFSSLIFTLYLQIYKQSALIKIHQDAMTYIIQICEDIDLKNYDDTEDLNKYTDDLILSSGINTERYKLSLEQEKYIDTHGVSEDIVKKIEVKIKYEFDGQNRDITVNKIKVREGV